MRSTDSNLPLERRRGQVFWGKDCIVGQYLDLGMVRDSKARDKGYIPEIVQIGSRCLLGSSIIIREGTTLGDGVNVGDGFRIGHSCSIGDRTQLVHGGFIDDEVEVGDDAVVAGFVGERWKIGDKASFMGKAVHTYPNNDVWGETEAAGVIEEGAIVGMGAVLVGGITIGKHAYVGANAFVSRDVPDNYVAIGRNEFTPRSEWHGEALGRVIRGEPL